MPLRQSHPRRDRVVVLGCSALACALTALGCGGASTKGSGNSATPARPFAVAIIRLGDDWNGVEPDDRVVSDGLKFGGLEEGSGYKLTPHNAGGDLAKIPDLVAEAVAAKADAIITLNPWITRIVAAKAGAVPVVFGLAADPLALGLGSSVSDHKDNVTGVFTPFQDSMLARIARGSIPKAQRFGVLVNPDEPLSVAHQAALIKSDVIGVPFEAAEYHEVAQIPAAVQKLVTKPVDAIFLTLGVGSAAPEVIAAARAAKIPVFGFTEAQVRAGAVLARVAVPRWGGFEAGRRAARVLNGEKADSIPFASQGSGFMTFVNSDAAKELKVAIPGPLLRDAITVKATAKP